MQAGKSKGAVVRNAIMEVTDDGAVYPISDIKLKLQETKGMKYGEDYTEGNLASSLSALEKKGMLKKLGRGIYQNVHDAEQGKKEEDKEIKKFEELRKEKEEQRNFDDIVTEYTSILERCENEMNWLIERIEVANMRQDDADWLKRILRYKEVLDELLQDSKDRKGSLQ